MIKNVDKYSVFIYLAIAIVTAGAYYGVANYQFVNFDDSDYVVNNPQFSNGFTLDNIKWAFTAGHAGNWHPLTWLSHILDCRLFGLDAGKHHIVGLLIHIANALLFFALLRKMTGTLWQSAFAAALFALHPLRVESVAWVAERKDVLSTLFWMLTMLAYVSYAKQPKLWRYFLVLVLFALGLMTKPMLVTLPFVLLLLDYWPLERLNWKNNKISQKPPKQKTKTIPQYYSAVWLITEKIPLFIAVIISSVITFIVQQKGGAMDTGYSFSLISRIANALIAYVTYIQKMLWPSGLAPFYPHPADNVSLLYAGLCAIMLLAATVLVIIFGRRFKYLPVGWFWYLGTLVPVIGIIQVGDQAYADRYSYIPLTGLFIIIALAVPSLFDRFLNVPNKKLILTASTAIVLTVLSVCTFIQQHYWHDSITLFEHAINVTKDNYVAHFCIADPLREKGRVKDAITHDKECLRIKPDYIRGLNSLGQAMIETGQLDEAVKYFDAALKLRPDLYQVHTNLGVALVKLGKFDEAIVHYRAALQSSNLSLIHLNLAFALRAKGNMEQAVQEYSKVLIAEPANVSAHYELGVTFAEMGKPEQAIMHLSKALEINPNLPDAHNSLGYVLAHTGKFDEAIGHCNEALCLQPNFVEARSNLGFAFLCQNKLDLAIEEYRKVLNALPGNYNTYNDLGVALYKQGKIDQAIEQFKQALLIKPDYADAKNNLATVLAIQQQGGKSGQAEAAPTVPPKSD